MTDQQIQYRLDQLPQHIVVKGRIHKLEYNASDTESNLPVYTLGYTSFADYPNKQVFCFYEESTPEMCLIKTWRDLALKKDEWK
jgi:hypothetical protein